MRLYAAWSVASTRLSRFETADRAILYRSYEIGVLSLSNSYPVGKMMGA
jgi:hypothetical protein